MKGLSETEFVTGYRHGNRRKLLFVLICSVIAAVTFFISLFFGPSEISVQQCIDALMNHYGNVTDELADMVIWEIRIPEACMALITGVALAAGGAVMQTSLRNPLADPYIMGVSSGAYLGVAVFMAFGICVIPGLSQNYSVVINAFVVSLVPMTVILIASSRGKISSGKLILIGIAVMYIFSATTSLIKVLADEETLAEIYQWGVGSLSGQEWDEIGIALAVTIAGLFLLALQARNLDAVNGGPNIAKAVGVNVKFVILYSMTLVSLVTAGVVAFTGTIGFVGLVAPNIARLFVGNKMKYLIPASASFGAMFLIIADTIAKVVTPTGIPCGVVASVIGGPIFVIILMRQRKKALL
ncbi:MAG: iron ABC transporter permease [Candidatus Methanomethylophilaceae archaeon]|nr:iron ABC transporter permease [Candidatus Methanomethylophilaceae archaeon]